MENLDKRLEELFRIQKDIAGIISVLRTQDQTEERQSAIRSLCKAFENISRIQVRIVAEGTIEYYHVSEN